MIGIWTENFPRDKRQTLGTFKPRYKKGTVLPSEPNECTPCITGGLLIPDKTRTVRQSTWPAARGRATSPKLADTTGGSPTADPSSLWVMSWFSYVLIFFQHLERTPFPPSWAFSLPLLQRTNTSKSGFLERAGFHLCLFVFNFELIPLSCQDLSRHPTQFLNIFPLLIVFWFFNSHPGAKNLMKILGMPQAQLLLVWTSSIFHSQNVSFLVDSQQMCWLKVSTTFHGFILFKQRRLKDSNIWNPLLGTTGVRDNI